MRGFGRAACLGALWAVGAVLPATNASSQEFTCEQILQQYQQATVFIQGSGVIPGGGTATWTGTGFIVHKSGYVLSNSHVVGTEDFTEVELRAKLGSRENSDTFNLELIKRDDELDLALLKLPQQNIDYVTVAVGDSNTAVRGQSICVLGFPRKQDLTVVEGKLQGTNNPKGRFQTTAALNLGNSGGPVFGTDGGRVLAVVVSGYPDQEQIDFAIPVNHARYLLLLTGALRGE